MAKFNGVLPAEAITAMRSPTSEIKEHKDIILNGLHEWMDDYKAQVSRLAAPLRPQFEETHQDVVRQVGMMIRRVESLGFLDPENVAKREAGAKTAADAMRRWGAWASDIKKPVDESADDEEGDIEDYEEPDHKTAELDPNDTLDGSLWDNARAADERILTAAISAGNLTPEVERYRCMARAYYRLHNDGDLYGVERDFEKATGGTELNLRNAYILGKNSVLEKVTNQIMDAALASLK